MNSLTIGTILSNSDPLHNLFRASRKRKHTRAKGGGRKVQGTSPSLALNNSFEGNTVGNRDNHESVMLKSRVIEATHAIGPKDPKDNSVTTDPFMYWHAKKPEACALKLILRYPDIVRYADKHYFGVGAMARKWAPIVSRKATNERAIQIAYIKNVWLSSKSPFNLVKFCLASEQPKNVATPTPMVVSSDLALSGINSVSELRALIRSNRMYTNEVVYNCFCAGLESGALKQSEKLPPTPIKKLITIPHEAHFRLELWFSLSRPGFNHSPNKDWNFTRKREWNSFLALVLEDRKNNEVAAHRNRMQMMNENDDDDDSNDDGDDEGGIDPKYLAY